MITASIHILDRDPQGFVEQTSYTLTTDAGYNPDAADDIVKRVLLMRHMDAVTARQREQDELAEDTEETHE